MNTAKCNRCGAPATGSSFDAARSKLDHAVGLRKGKPCHDRYNKVVEINKEKPKEKKPEIKNEIKQPKIVRKVISKTETKKDNTFISKD